MPKKDKSFPVKLIVNPAAGKVSDTDKNLKLVTGYLKENGLKVDVGKAKPKEKATRIAKRAVKDGYKIVIALGGDGTVKAVMRGMIGSKARLGIIPTGIENNIANSLGIPKGLKEACAMIATDNTRELDSGQIKTRKGKKLVFFEMAAIGLSSAISPVANKIASDKLSNKRVNPKTLTHPETSPNVIMTLNDDQKVKVNTVLVMVSNSPVFGKNFVVAPEASLQDGLLDVSVYPDFSKAELLGYYAAVMDGGYKGDGKIQHYQARKLKVKASPKLDVMADGMPLGKGSVTIKVRPGALRVIANEKSPVVESPQKNEAETLPEPDPPAVKKSQKIQSKE